MLIISLFGGLGNQMFQYACGKSMATRLDVELKLDIQLLLDRTPRERFTYRNYELEEYNLNEKIATYEETRLFVPNIWNSTKMERQYFKFKRIILGNNLFFEKSQFQYNKEIESIGDNTYIYGYFQTEDYFINIRDIILESFKLKNELNSENKSLLSRIKNENSVSIHVRRGDYVNSIFELLSIDKYYNKAIDKILENVESPVFYIFSNDHNWVENNLTKRNITKEFVKLNDQSWAGLDMFLMSNCKHNIIANSSYSWWGAWLNPKHDKIVIAPEKWFRSNYRLESTWDLVPKNWIKI